MSPPEPEESYPRELSLTASADDGAIAEADGAKTYFAETRDAWRTIARLVRPDLNVEPMGNC